MGRKFRVGYNQSCHQFPCIFCDDDEETCACTFCHTSDPEEYCCCCTVFCKSDYLRCCKCGPNECALDCEECFRHDYRPREPYVTWDRCCAQLRCLLGILCIQNVFIFVTALISSTLHFVLDVWKIVFGCLGCAWVESGRACCTQLSCWCCICQLVPPSEEDDLDEESECCGCIYCTDEGFYSKWPCESFQELHAGVPSPVVIYKESQVPGSGTKQSSPRVHKPSKDKSDNEGDDGHTASSRHEHSERHHKHQHHHHRRHRSHSRGTEHRNHSREDKREHHRDNKHTRDHHSNTDKASDVHSVKDVISSVNSPRGLELGERRSKSPEKVVVDQILRSVSDKDSAVIECYYDDSSEHDVDDGDGNDDKHQYVKTSKVQKEKSSTTKQVKQLGTSIPMAKISKESPGHSKTVEAKKEPISVRMQRIRSKSLDKDCEEETSSELSETSSSEENVKKPSKKTPEMAKSVGKTVAKRTNVVVVNESESSTGENKSSSETSTDISQKPEKSNAVPHKVKHQSRADNRTPAMFHYENERKDKTKPTEDKVNAEKVSTAKPNAGTSKAQQVGLLPPLALKTDERFPLERTKKESKKGTKDKKKGSPISPEVKDKMEVSQDVKDKTQVNQEAKDKTLVNQEAKDKSRVNQEAKDKTQVNQEAKDKSQVNREAKNKTLVNKEATDKTQVEQESNYKPGVKREANEKAQVNQEARDKTGANQEAKRKTQVTEEVMEKTKVETKQSAPKDFASRPFENSSRRIQDLDLFVEDLSDTSLICYGSELETNEYDRTVAERLTEKRPKKHDKVRTKKNVDSNEIVEKLRESDPNDRDKVEKERYKVKGESGKDRNMIQIKTGESVKNLTPVENPDTNVESHSREYLEVVTPARPKNDSTLRKKLSENSHFRTASSDNASAQQGTSSGVSRSRECTPLYEKTAEVQENAAITCGTNSLKRKQRRERMASTDVRTSAEKLEGVSLVRTPVMVGEELGQKQKSGEKKKSEKRRERMTSTDVRTSVEKLEGISPTRTPVTVGEDVGQKEKSGERKKKKPREGTENNQ